MKGIQMSIVCTKAALAAIPLAGPEIAYKAAETAGTIWINAAESAADRPGFKAAADAAGFHFAAGRGEWYAVGAPDALAAVPVRAKGGAEKPAKKPKTEKPAKAEKPAPGGSKRLAAFEKELAALRADLDALRAVVIALSAPVPAVPAVPADPAADPVPAAQKPAPKKRGRQKKGGESA